MDLADQITALASRAQKQIEHITTEEATKTALVLPFINALGYNVFDPTEVVPEFTADIGIRKGEKVDYAIMLDGKPIMLIECKQAGADLNVKHASQLFRYFTVTDARIGVLTNGIQYRFFSDLEEKNKMDERPFLEFDLLDLKELLVHELKKLSKSAFDLDQLLSAAHELKYTKALKVYLAEQWGAPSDDFVKFLTKRVYDGLYTQSVREQFKDIVRRALHQFVNDRISDRLNAALREEEGGTEEEVLDLESSTAANDGIVTTDEEMEGFYIVRAILRETVDIARVRHRDVKSYFGILLDDNNRKPICRLHFNATQKYLGLFDEYKKEERVPIDSLDDIYQYADRIRATIRVYE
ncbi:MAG: type I restriction endonuclease [Rhodothermales bacterium]